MNVLIFILPSFIACLILTGIHTYLGIHVIKRGVIFVDIALAQSAALGLILAYYFGFQPESQMAYVISLVLTTLTALFFANFKDSQIPQEAVIGVVFAVFSAFGILILSQMPHGGEHLNTILSGNILWVDWSQILKTAVIYSLVGLIHFRYRHQLLEASINSNHLKKSGFQFNFWDLLFYVSFGLVITSSVQIGGILLVFSFLIVPALCSLIFFENLKHCILMGWILGILASVSGLALSFYNDLPAGPAIVGVFGVMFVGAVFVKYCRR